MSRPGPSLPPPSKKRKLDKNSALLESITNFENELNSAAAANSSLNPLADLLELAVTCQDAQQTSKAIYALYRVFVVLIQGGKLGPSDDEAARVVKSWIWEKLRAYVDFLCELLKDEEKLLRTSSLQILFSLQKHLSTATSVAENKPQFHGFHFRSIVSALLLCPSSRRAPQSNPGVLDPDVQRLFLETWFSVHDDVRWFFLRDAGTTLNTVSISEHPHVAQNLLGVLEALETFPTEKGEINSWWVAEIGAKPPKVKSGKKKGQEESDEEENVDPGLDEDDWRKFFDEDSRAKDVKSKGPEARLHNLTLHQSLHSLSSHRAVFTRVWLGLLPKLTAIREIEQRKALSTRALNVMHRGVIPHLTRPVLVMDWVGECVDLGGTVGLLALNALFLLMKDYNLDYPSFYTRLYAFLDRDVLHSKHRARFFRLTEVFLGSTHISAAVVASFVKKLARLSLSAPPAAIVLVMPFTYNALKRHPALMPLIHRTYVGTEDDEQSSDPFDVLEPNPNSTRALESSLWELASHRSHYLAGISTLSKILTEAFTKQSYSMEDFLDHTYGTLFDADAARKIKKEPPVALEMGKNVELFREEVVSNVTTDLWSIA